MRILAEEAASRTRGELSTGLGWISTHPQSYSTSIHSDPMSQWYADEAESLTRQETRQRAHHRAMILSGCFVLAAGLATLTWAELPGGLSKTGPLADAQRSFRLVVAAVMGIEGNGTLPSRATGPMESRFLASTRLESSLRVPDANLQTGSVEVVVRMVNPQVQGGHSLLEAPDEITLRSRPDGEVRRLITSARAAEDLRLRLAPWQDQRLIDSRIQLVSQRFLTRQLDGDGEVIGQPDQIRCYRAPASVAVTALRKTIAADYPSVENLGALPEDAVLEVMVRPVAGTD
jgi:hypothetical protein